MLSSRWKKLWARDFGLQFFYMPTLGFGSDIDLLRHQIKEVLVLPEQKMESIFVPAEEFNRFLKALDEYYLGNLANLERFIQEFPSIGERFVANVRMLANRVTELSNEELSGRLVACNKEFGDYGAPLWVTFYLNELMSERVSGLVAKSDLSMEEKSALLTYATSPARPSGLLLLAGEAKRKSVSELVQEFGWLTTLDIHTNRATESDLKERLLHTKAVETDAPEVPSDLQKTIALSRETTYLKDLRDDYRRKGILESFPLYDEVGKRTGLGRNNLSYLATPEIAEILTGAADTASLQAIAEKRRTTGFSFLLKEGEVTIEEDSEALQALAVREGIDRSIPVSSEIKEVRGVTGCKGKVQGRVVIVNGVGEIGKVKDGDVMCTVTTNPDYLPAMQRAVAIVTDEGGITCHAAIVAREMGKPCIVGTKNGTKVFGDGDLVEVDADRGMITRS